ncbi:MAG: pyruvate, phosphate dikinase [Actinomycetota bacterium]|nr:pyruvate, phosphate dikinase [Actinomycetota bacterium]
MSERWIYAFDDIDAAMERCDGDWDRVRGLLGGKGANLADMIRLGISVPPGLTITSEACTEYLANDHGTLPDGLLEELATALRTVEDITGKKLGDPSNPLLVSCRSGSKSSMPGMMDTVLNIGLNDDVAHGMAELFDDRHFALDSYRRLIQMFASVVMGVPDEAFETVLRANRRTRDVASNSDLPDDDLERVVEEFKEIFRNHVGRDFPTDPIEQLTMTVRAVFRSWNGKRAIAYRAAAGIPDDLGTAVNVQAMVFGNTGPESATGVVVSRSATTGAPKMVGDFLINAQGEDVVAGIRQTSTIEEFSRVMPELHAELEQHARTLERHYRDVQDIEFTIERGKLWLLQTRNAKRTAQAAVRIAVDLVSEGVITREDALKRVTPEQVEFFLHPQFDARAKRAAIDEGRKLTEGLNVSPGAAVGIIALDADLAEQWASERDEPIILVRPETKPDDIHGMLASAGVLTSSGGRTSHAALVARQFGKPAVVGAQEIEVKAEARMIMVGSRAIREGDWISLDGSTGEVFLGQIETSLPEFDDPWLMTLLTWADEIRELDVWTNADHPADAVRAFTFGANGIGLCRTEHMFFATNRLPIVQRMIMASDDDERREALSELLPLQRSDFAGLFRAMDGKRVIIRLLDPPLHEFLPNQDDLMRKTTDLKIGLMKAGDLAEVNALVRELEEAEHILRGVEALHESNPMLGLRGVRLAILIPDLPEMQIRAIFEATLQVLEEGVVPKPGIMIPLTSDAAELTPLKEIVERMADEVLGDRKDDVDYAFGTMIETPRAALTAGALAETAEFFSFGTNDLTQMTFGISRDDAEKAFLIDYLKLGVFTDNPFETLDREGVGSLIRSAVAAGRSARPDIHIGICGEHGGDPASIALFDEIGIDYVSCSPLRVPVARLAAAQAVLNRSGKITVSVNTHAGPVEGVAPGTG